MDYFKKRKAYTLVELLVSMTIFASLLVMFSYITFAAIGIANDISIRSKYRESITEVMGLIKRDIRNADNILECTGKVCKLSIGDIYTWKVCLQDIAPGYSICKFKTLKDGTEQILKKTADNIYINNITFESMSISNGVTIPNSAVENSTIILTIEAVPLKNKNDLVLAKTGQLLFDVRQVIISTRNISF